MNDVMPLIFIMEQTLTAMIQQRMEEGSHLAMDVEEEEEEEEDEETGPEEELDLEMESQEGIGDEAAAQHDSDG
ncbi:hypothetical protein, partial [Salmonella sp. S090_02723]|uniref:hypothetical protein n=1 Tax=Salmonella sp. S090_02723 TaxID=2665583 RepID=UPI001CA93DCC